MSNSPTILVIDYDPGSVRSTREPLENAGYTVEVASDGEEGLLAFERIKPDLVLIEPMVPKRHGFQVCRQIKSTTDGKKTPVLITTAFYRGRKHRTEAQQNYGCDDYLEKPIPEELLLSTCRKYLIDIQAPATEVADAEEAAPQSRHSGLPSLDDLSDDEIQARLDALIDEEIQLPGSDPSPAPAADAVALVPEDVATAVAQEPFVDSPAAPAQTEEAHEQPEAKANSQNEIATVEAESPMAEQVPQAALAEPETPARASRLPLWIALAAVVFVASGAAILWTLQGRDEAPTGFTTQPATNPEPASPPLSRERGDPAAATHAAAGESAPAVDPGSRLLTAPIVAAPAERARTDETRPGELVALENVDRVPVAESTPAPVFPHDARDAASAQPVVLRLLIDETGRVSQIEIDAAGSDALFLDSVMGAAKGWTYEPAVKDGVPVKVWITETFGVEPSPTGQAS